MFYKSYFVFHENKLSQKETFVKIKRNFLITQTQFLLVYLRSGFVNLSEVDYLIFEPKALTFSEENSVETIMREFYVPMFNQGVRLPKVFIVDSFGHEARSPLSFCLEQTRPIS